MMAAALLLSVVSAAALAQTPVLDFRGTPLGAPESAFKAANPRWSCGVTPEVLRAFADSYCNINNMDSLRLGDPSLTNFGGVDVRILNADFIDGKFAKLAVTYTPAFYDQIAGAMKAKFGPPTTETREPFVTKGGAADTNDIASWEFPNGSVSVRRYSTSLSNGMVLYSSSEATAQIRLRESQRAKKGAGSL